MKRFSLRFIAVIMLCLALAGCVSQQDFNALQQRVSQHGQRLDSVEQIRPNQANLSAELDTIRSQIADLRGRMDELERRFMRPSPTSLPPYSQEPAQTMPEDRMETAMQPGMETAQPDSPTATDEALADLGMTNDQAEELGAQ